MNRELEIEIPSELEIEPVTAVVLAPAAPAIDILSADEPLPRLIRFVPNQALRREVDAAIEATRAAGLIQGAAVQVSGVDGIAAADVAMKRLRDAISHVEADFAGPAADANRVHKEITGTRAAWTDEARALVGTLGRAAFNEQGRLDREAAEAARVAQEAADKLVREAATKEAEQAEAAQAPARVVEQLQQQAKTATAAPVTRSTFAPSKPANSAAVKTWKARLKGSPAQLEPNPETSDLTPQQVVELNNLLRAVIDGTVSRAAVLVNWSYLNKRAGADKGTLDIPGIEAFEDGTMRGKGGRR